MATGTTSRALRASHPQLAVGRLAGSAQNAPMQADTKAPTLLIFADADAIRPEHVVEFYKLLGGGQRDAGVDGSLRSPNRLAIIPNTTHLTLLGSATVMHFASEFLNSR